MVTVKEVKALYDNMSLRIELFGATPEYLKEFNRLHKAIGKAIMEEQDIDDCKKATTLPMNTVLGEKALAALERFKQFISLKD